MKVLPNLWHQTMPFAILANKNSYIYTKNYGWIDRGHAGFLGGKKLIKKLYTDILYSEVGKSISYEMTSGGKVGPVKVAVNAVNIKIQIIKPIHNDPVIAREITLHILKKTSYIFEELQARTDWMKKSSFAEEDLPSNILNFYFEVYSRDEANIMQHCIPFSKGKSAWIYDRYTFNKNRIFDPVIRYPNGIKPWIVDSVQEREESEYYRIIELRR